MELQPIVGTPCAVCEKSILVDIDGTNCARCGLAMHRGECATAHKAKCTNRPAVAIEKHDYDEVGAIVWNARLIGVLSVAAFVAMVGVGMFAGPMGEPAAGETSPTAPMSTLRMALAIVAIVAGVTLAIVGYSTAKRETAG